MKKWLAIFFKYLLIVLGIAVGIALIAGLYYYQKVTAKVSLAGFKPPDRVDITEGNRKLKLFEEASRSAKPGFVRLTEDEINSLIHEQLAAAKKRPQDKNPPPPAPTTCRLQNFRVRLLPNEIVCFSWVTKPWLGRSWDLVWQRNLALRRGADRWVFETKSMRLGRLTIPPRFWDWIEQHLGSADQSFTERRDWVTHLPAVSIKPNDLNQALELRLYTYLEPDAFKANP